MPVIIAFHRMCHPSFHRPRTGSISSLQSDYSITLTQATPSASENFPAEEQKGLKQWQRFRGSSDSQLLPPCASSVRAGCLPTGFISSGLNKRFIRERTATSFISYAPGRSKTTSSSSFPYAPFPCPKFCVEEGTLCHVFSPRDARAHIAQKG